MGKNPDLLFLCLIFSQIVYLFSKGIRGGIYFRVELISSA